MAVLSGATASGRQFYQGLLSTTTAILYTAPAASSNVTSPSATAYIKEIILCNTTGTAATVTIMVGGSAPANTIFYTVTVNADDSKVISGLNTMISAGSTIQGYASTASAIACTISGVEVQ